MSSEVQPLLKALKALADTVCPYFETLQAVLAVLAKEEPKDPRQEATDHEAWVRKMAFAFFAANVAEAAGESFDLPAGLSPDEAEKIATHLYEAEPEITPQNEISAPLATIVEGYGHCDTCGALCDYQGCTVDRDHLVALP